MPRGGHNRKSNREKQVNGNPGKRQPSARRGVHSGDLPVLEPPDRLPEGAKLVWRRVVELDRAGLGIILAEHQDLLAGFCFTVDEMWAAADELAKDGLTFKMNTGYVGVHPAVAVRRRAISQIKQLAERLGLDPAGAVKYGDGVPQDAKDDPMAEFLKLNVG